MMITSRRSFLVGLGAALVAAPAIVRVPSIMPVKQMMPTLAEWQIYYLGNPIFSDGGYPSSVQILFEQRVANAERVFARNLRRSLDDLVYKTGTSADGGLSELFG